MTDIKITWDIENCASNSCVSNPVQPAGAPRLFVDGQEGSATDAGFNGKLNYNGITYASYTKECGRGGGRTGNCSNKSEYRVATITTDYLPQKDGQIKIEFQNKGSITPPSKTSKIEITNNSNRQVKVSYRGIESLVCPKNTTSFTVGLATTFTPFRAPTDNCPI